MVIELSYKGEIEGFRMLFPGSLDTAAILTEIQNMSQKVDELKARLASIGDKTSAEHTEVMEAISELQQKIADLSGGATEAEMTELQSLADALEESVTHIYDKPAPPEEPTPNS